MLFCNELKLFVEKQGANLKIYFYSFSYFVTYLMEVRKYFFNFAVQFNLKCSSGGIGRPVCRQAGALRLEVMIFVYATSSIEKNYIYVGMTRDIKERFKRHNLGREKTTRAYAPFQLLYTEECIDRVDGRKREKYWKSGVGKERLREIRNNYQK